jgi:hypothetical protein
MRKFFCRFVGHRRSVKLARRSSDGWSSVCTSCGVKMVRVAPKHWIEEAHGARSEALAPISGIMFVPTQTMI